MAHGEPSRLRARLSELWNAITTRLSPNRSSRSGASIMGAVVHTTEGSFLGSLSWMLNNASDVSAHYIISDVVHPGERFTQVVRLVPEDEKAWTAKSANPVSNNYELAGFARRTRREWLTQFRPQLETAAALIAEDTIEYHIPIRRSWPGIVGHADLDGFGFPNDHTDPGSGFPWDVFLQMVKDYVALGLRPDVEERPVRAAHPCLPKTLTRIPKEAYALAAWHLSGRVGPRPSDAPRNILRTWPWYWDWFHCRYFGRSH